VASAVEKRAKASHVARCNTSATFVKRSLNTNVAFEIARNITTLKAHEAVKGYLRIGVDRRVGLLLQVSEPHNAKVFLQI